MEVEIRYVKIQYCGKVGLLRFGLKLNFQYNKKKG